MSRAFITKKGMKKLKEELHELTVRKRPEVAERIREAVSFGDLSENAEYAEAKEQQAFIEGRIFEIENILRNATLVSTSPSKILSARIGCVVHLASGRQKESFQIVGKGEGNPASGEISSDSPIGSAVLGRGVGDEIDVPLPSGRKRYKIIKIA